MDRIQELLAQVAEMERRKNFAMEQHNEAIRERNEERQFKNIALKQRDALQNKNRVLRKALEKHGRHKPMCAGLRGWSSDCDCGLLEALAAPAPESSCSGCLKASMHHTCGREPQATAPESEEGNDV